MSDENPHLELPNLKPSGTGFRATFVTVEVVDREGLKFDDLKNAILKQTLAKKVKDWPQLARENAIISQVSPGEPFHVDWCCANKHMWFAASQMSADVANIYVGGLLDAISFGPEKHVASWTIEHLDNIVSAYREIRGYRIKRVIWNAELFVNLQPSSIKTINPPGFWQTVKSLDTAPQLIPIITAGIIPVILKKLAERQQPALPSALSLTAGGPPNQRTFIQILQIMEPWAPIIVAIVLWFFVTYLTYAKGKGKRIWSVIGWDRVPGSSQ